MPQTVAQLVAILSVDSKAMDTRLAKLEDDLNNSKKQFESLSQTIDKTATASATSIGKVSNALKEEQRAADNLAKFEYQTNQKSAQEYQSYLNGRIAATKASTSEFTRLTNQLVAVNREANSRMAADDKARNEENATQARLINAEKLNSEKVYLQGIVASLKSQEDAEKALQKAKEDTAKSAAMAADQQKAAVASLARYEYEQGNLSVAAYKTFLERRMADYAEYTAQWKSAASQLVSVDRQIEQEKAANAKAADDEILAHQKEIASQRSAIEREVNAEMAAWDKEYVAGFVAQMDEAAIATAASKKKMAEVRGSVGAGIGTGAAAIGAVELGSSILAANFDHAQTGIANNTLMTNDDIKQMRETTLQLARDTGQPLEDLAKGYMHITNFGNNAAQATKILTLANKEAVATLAPTEDVANALGTSLHIFGANANQAAGYMDVLHHSAAEGNLTVKDFVDNTGKALAIGAGLGLKFYDVATVLSLLSKAGFDAAQSATQVQSLVAHIADPTNEATKNIMALQKAFKEANPKSDIDLMFDFTQAGMQAKTLLGVLKDIEIVTGGNASEILKTTSALRGGVGEVMLAHLTKTGGEADRQEAQAKQLQTSNSGSETEAVYQRMMQDSAQKVKQFVTVLQTDFIPVGEKAIQIFVKFEPAIAKGADAVLSIMNAFQKLPVPIQEAVTAIGGLFIIEKFTGILTALRVPVALGAGLRTIAMGLGNIGKGVAFLEGTPFAETLAAWGASLGVAGEAAGGLGIILGGPIVWGIAAIVAAIALLAVAWVRDWGHIREATNSVWEGIKRGGVEAFLVISDANAAWTRSDDAARAYILKEWSIFKTAVSSNLADIKKGFLETGPDILKGLGLGPIITAFDKMFTSIENRLSKFTSNMSSGISNWWDNSTVGKYLKTVSDRADTITGVNSTYNGFSGSNGFSPDAEGSIQTLGTAGPIGSKAALAADAEQANTSAHNCEQRAREIIQSSTHAFDSLFAAADPISHKVTAKSVAAAMDAAGVLQDYKPGMPLKPGDLLYSTSLGAKDNTGHVSEIDSKGNRRDQYGVNHFAESNYQKVFDPDYANSRLNNGQDNTVTSVTPEMLAASVANEKERAKQLKDSAKAAKELETSYKSHLASLLRIAAVGEGVDKSKTNDTRITKYEDATRAEFNQGGQLYGISSKEQSTLMSAARKADSELDFQKKLKEQEKIANEHAEAMKEIQKKIQTAKDDMLYAKVLEAPGNAALKGAVADAGGIEEWKKLGVQPTDVGPRRINGRSDAQQDYVDFNQDKIGAGLDEQLVAIRKAQTDEQQASIDNNKKSIDYDARAEGIDKFNVAHEKLIKDIALETDATQKLKDTQMLNAERGLAGDIANNENIYSHGNSLDSQSADNNAKMQESILSQQQATTTLGDYAVKQWEASAAGKDMIKTLGATSDKVIAYEQSLRDLTGQLDQTKGVLQEQSLFNDINKQALDLSAKNPFEAWLDGFKTLQTTVGADGGVTTGYLLPNGMNVDDMKQIYNMQLNLAQLQKAQEMKKEIIGGLSTAIGAGVMSALSPNPQQTGQYQSQLLQQQQELQQYQVAEAQFKSQYPGDPNDPYITRLQQIQQQIGVTKNKLNDMGNNLGAVFTRLFGGIYASFTQTLTKMAQSYLQSALLGYLTKQIGTGQGAVSGQGSGGILGTIAGFIGTGLSLFGGSGSSSGTSNASAASVSNVFNGSYIPKFAAGGAFSGNGNPIMVGEKGPEIIVPNAPGTVIPMSKVGSSSIGNVVSGGSTIINNKFNQTVNTPDVRGFRSSRATQAQNVKRQFRKM